jgi:hypothetical protein
MLPRRAYVPYADRLLDGEVRRLGREHPFLMGMAVLRGQRRRWEEVPYVLPAEMGRRVRALHRARRSQRWTRRPASRRWREAAGAPARCPRPPLAWGQRHPLLVASTAKTSLSLRMPATSKPIALWRPIDAAADATTTRR